MMVIRRILTAMVVASISITAGCSLTGNNNKPTPAPERRPRMRKVTPKKDPRASKQNMGNSSMKRSDSEGSGK